MKIVVSAVFVFLAAAIAFSTIQNMELRKQSEALEARIASLESTERETPAAPAPAPGTKPSAHATTSPTDVAATAPGTAPKENRPEDPALRIAGTDGTGASTPTVGGPGFNPSAWTEAERSAFSAEVASALEAQRKEREARQAERQAEWMMSRMKQNLKLTDQQAQAIQQVVGRTMTAVDTLRESMTPENREEIRPQIQQTLQTADTEIKTYLTAEQVTSYDALKQSGGLWGGGDGGRRGGRPEGGAR
ncbi:MAG: hypothetical protein HUU15_18050 [Candidatus Brocadiae bacterium]|nr:hypothetical protein [Candidatus Brocadiia bacterium]